MDVAALMFDLGREQTCGAARFGPGEGGLPLLDAQEWKASQLRAGLLLGRTLMGFVGWRSWKLDAVRVFEPFVPPRVCRQNEHQYFLSECLLCKCLEEPLKAVPQAGGSI